MLTKQRMSQETPTTMPAQTEEQPFSEELTEDEIAELYQPAAELLVRTNWDRLPKILATAQVLHRLLDKERPRLHQAASAVLKTVREQL